MPLAFERTEYQERLRRVRAAMQQVGLDVLLVFHQEHMYYLAGYDQIGYWVYQVLIVPAAEMPMTAIVRKIDELLIREAGLVNDVRAWFDDTRLGPAEQTVQVLREIGLADRKRVGIEQKSHALLPYYYDRLRETLDSAELVDASDLIAELRLVKSAREIDYMRQAGEVMDTAVRAAFALLRPGIRECDIQAAVMHAMFTAGGEAPAVPPPMGSGPRILTQTHGGATTRVIEAGDPFLLEVGACLRRYHAVCMRMGSVGQPSGKIRAMHDAARAATDLGMSEVKPGVACADLARIVLDELERRGYSQRGQHVGYGIGLGYPPTWLDNLRIKETDSHVLRPGMTFLFFSTLLDRDMFVALGDPILVTSDGYERLTTLPREIEIT